MLVVTLVCCHRGRFDVEMRLQANSVNGYAVVE